MMAKWMLLGAIGLAIPLMPAPAAAQTQNGVLVIFGDDKCPTDSDGNEIVVCARKPETERYRVPKELRQLDIAPVNRSWAQRQQDLRHVNDTGTGSCSAVGAGGFTGCLAKTLSEGAAETKKRNEDADRLPE